MDLADAALVRVAEREDLTRIFTLDRRHFSVYRPGRRRRFSILPVLRTLTGIASPPGCRCIPPGCVARRLHSPDMRAPRALPAGRLDTQAGKPIPISVLSDDIAG